MMLYWSVEFNGWQRVMMASLMMRGKVWLYVIIANHISILQRSIFRVTTFGESHCKGVGVIVDGCPPGMPLTEEDVQPQLNRRRPGQSALTTPVSRLIFLV
jgi:hypothetical protein